MNTGETIALIKAFGNGGGGSSSSMLVVTKSGNTADKTFAEMSAAIDAGQGIILKDGNLTFYVYKKDNNYIYFNSGIINNGYYSARCSNTNVWSSVGFACLPIVSSTDNGCEAIVKNGAWAKQQKKFVVTLTPTAQDFSGTMDKTVAEINTAYEAGQQLVFRVMMSATTHMDVDCTARWFGIGTYPSFNGFILGDTNNVLIFAYTSTTDDGTKQTYSTKVYSLTPAS